MAGAREDAVARFEDEVGDLTPEEIRALETEYDEEFGGGDGRGAKDDSGEVADEHFEDLEAEFAKQMSINRKLTKAEANGGFPGGGGKKKPLNLRRQPQSSIPKQQRLRVGRPGESARWDYSHSNYKVQQINRGNALLLQQLNSVQRKGGVLKTREAPKRHVASSSIQRRKQNREVAMANQALLRRLNGIKSSVAKQQGRGHVGGGGGGARTAQPGTGASRGAALPGPPRRRPRGPPKKLVQPEWVN